MQFEQEGCRWFVDRKVRPESLARIERACHQAGRGFEIIRVDRGAGRPAIDHPTPVPGQPFVLYGYASLLIAASADPAWRAGVFYDGALFRPSVYLANWGAERMLNHDAGTMTLGEFLDPGPPAGDGPWFIRPDDDLKPFAGGVVTRASLPAILAAEPGGIPPLSTPVLVARPKKLGSEWRLFVVDGGIVAQSCYTGDGFDRPVPPELRDFARDAVRAWSPAPAFALDVTVTEKGSPRIIEANCINGTGFYHADVGAVVHALSRYQELTWPA
ncbi:MAG: ATP-grasp domain-containing protein [Chloroflexota bacterium]